MNQGYIKDLEELKAEQSATIHALKLEIERRDEYINKLEKTIKELNKKMDELEQYKKYLVDNLIENYI